MPSDPRVFFASERTLLAWVRTGIAVVGLGFVVSRFGLFLHLIAAQSRPGSIPASHGYANVLGMLLVILGAACMVAASIQHGRFIATLPEHDRPASYSRTWAIALAALLAAASGALAVYLGSTAP